MTWWDLMFKTFIFATVTLIWVGEGRSKGSYHEPIVPGLLGPDAWKKNPTIFSPNCGEQMVMNQSHGIVQSTKKIHQLKKSQNMERCWSPLTCSSPVRSREYHPPKFNSKSPWNKWMLRKITVHVLLGSWLSFRGELLNLPGLYHCCNPHGSAVETATNDRGSRHHNDVGLTNPIPRDYPRSDTWGKKIGAKVRENEMKMECSKHFLFPGWEVWYSCLLFFWLKVSFWKGFIIYIFVLTFTLIGRTHTQQSHRKRET